MRVFLSVATIVGAAALGGCSKPEGLNGEWIGKNYQCPFGIYHEEKITVTDKGRQIVGVKVTGDDCVPAGHITFKGTREALTCVVGTTTDPASSEISDKLEMIDDNSFRACGVTFVRG